MRNCFWSVGFWVVLIIGPFLPDSTWGVTVTADHLVISQIQITGGSGKTTNDFIEIHNPTTADLDLKGLRLVKRTKTGTTDTLVKSWTASTMIKAQGYYLWANSDFTEIPVTPDATTTVSIAPDNGVALRNGANNTGAIVDAVAWGEATNAFVEGQAFPTNPQANESLERKEDTNNNANDFFLTSAHPRNSTPGVASPPQTYYYQTPTYSYPTPQYSAPTSTSYAYPTPLSSPPSTLRISEMLPDPFGDDAKSEFIEIYNYGLQNINLENWAVADQKKHYQFSSTQTVLSLGYFVLYLEGTGISLNNSGDEIELFDPQEKLIQKLNYGKAPESQSYAWLQDETYQWTTSPTPGQENRFTVPVKPVEKVKEVSKKPAKSLEPEVLFASTPTSTPTTTPTLTAREEMVAAATTSAASPAQTKPFWRSANFWLILAPLVVICYIILRKLLIKQNP